MRLRLRTLIMTSPCAMSSWSATAFSLLPLSSSSKACLCLPRLKAAPGSVSSRATQASNSSVWVRRLVGGSVSGPKYPFSPSLSPLPRFSSMGGNASTAEVAEKSVHEFTVQDIDGKNVELNTYKDKVLLIVNVASQCGLTQTNYTELTEVYDKYKGKDFEILAFPSNQFGGQEPGTSDQIKEFACSRFKAEFPIFDKIDVNGPNQAPLYKFLKASKGGILGDNIKWNFSKFLVDKNGKVVQRYAPYTPPSKIEKDIKKQLGL